MKVKSLIQTCRACPSQWEGTLEDGRMIYIRYRWGNLSVNISPQPTNNISDAVHGITIYTTSIGMSLDGYIEEAKMKSLVRDILFFD